MIDLYLPDEEETLISKPIAGLALSRMNNTPLEESPQFKNKFYLVCSYMVCPDKTLLNINPDVFTLQT